MQGNEDKQRLADQVNRWITTIQNSKTLPTASSNPLLDVPDWWKPESVDPMVERAISGFRMSKEVLEQLGDDHDTGVSGNSFVLPLGVILDALPARCIATEVSAEDRARPIRIFIEDLYQQLARGAVRVTIARLVFGVPVGLISSVALRDTETVVNLPLKAVVEAIGTQALMERTAKATRKADYTQLPELFTPSSAATPKAETTAPEAVPVLPIPPVAQTAAPAPAPVAPAAPAPAEPAMADAPTMRAETPDPVLVTSTPAPVSGAAPVLVAETPATAAVAAPAAAPAAPREVYVSTAAMERLNGFGVDLNRATTEALLAIPGMTQTIAREIEAYRAQNGPFANIFALADVPRVGRKTFRKLTGMPHSRTHRHRGAVLAHWLGLDPAQAGNLPALVRAIGSRPGLAGCVMSDRDGLLLAESGAGERATALGAIVPRLVGQVRDNLRELGGEGVNSLTIAYDGRLITIVTGGDLFLTVIHAASRLTTGLHQFLRRIALELDWWFSRRVYVVSETPPLEPASHA